MRRLLFVPCVLLLACSLAFAEPPKLSISGPTKVFAGSAVFLQCETDAAAVDWIVFPTGAEGNFVPLTLYQGQTPDGKPILKRAAFFSSPTEGTYVFVAVGTKQDQLGKAVHILINGKAGPQPNPDPDPGPEPNPDPTPPPPPGKRFVMVVRESGEPSLELGRTLTGLSNYLDEKKHLWRIEDPNLVDKTEKTPGWFRVYLDRAAKEGVATPFLVVGVVSSDGKTITNVRIIPLPKTAAEAIKAVQNQGG